VVKILSQAGNSLADTYDVEGSIAGIDQLETRELPIVHEMGATVFSERLSGAIRRATSGAILQNTNFDIILTDLPATPSRVLGVTVVTDVAGRVSTAAILIRDAGAGREMPIFVWDSGEQFMVCRMVENNAAVGTLELLVTSLNLPGFPPSMIIGTDQPQEVDQIAFRGRSTGFGAGTVTITALIYLAFSEVGGISSRGLPIPGW